MKKIILIFLCLITLTLTGCNSKIDKFKEIPVVLTENGDQKIIMPVKDFAKTYVSTLESSAHEHNFKWRVHEIKNKSEKIKNERIVTYEHLNKLYILTYENDKHIIKFPIVIDADKKFDFCIGNNIIADREDIVKAILFAQ